MVAVQQNWQLLAADRASLWLGLQKAAGAGLRPDGQEGALVLFNESDDDAESPTGRRAPT